MMWTLTGTDAEKAISRETLVNRIKFPLDRLTRLPGSPELGWRDLNGGTFAQEVKAAQSDMSRSHEEHHDEVDRPHAIEVEMDGRWYTLGLIYTVSGRIYIDQSLVSRPMTAMTTIAAEIAHAVDLFMPMTDAMRNEFLRLWGKGGTWWEVNDYGSEYFTLGGEAFMREYVQAYAPSLDFASISGFMHDTGVEPEDVYRIIAIPRTDAPPPFVSYGTSKVYHRTTHYKRTGQRVTDMTGMRPCKVCKP